MIPGSATPLLLAQSGDDGYKIERSLRFNDDDDANLSFTPSTSSSMTTYTWSFWFKRSTIGNSYNMLYSTNGEYGIYFYFRNDKIDIGDYYGGGYQWRLQTDRLFRDISAWYHIVVAVDTTQATASDRVKMYINGVQETSFSIESYPSQNSKGSVNRASVNNRIGEMSTAGNFDGYLAEFHSVDGQQLSPTDFGGYDANNVWQPKEASFTSPNNGTTWSSFGSSSSSLENGNWGQVFDGTRYMYGGSGASNGPALANGSITFSPSGLSGRVVTAGVRGGSNKTYTVNGSAMTFGSSSAEVATIDLGSTQTITSVVGTSTASGVWAQFYWIAVDGVLLVDGAKKHGKNGFKLDFSDNSSSAGLGTDTSGNGNNWTPNNLQTSTGPTSVAAASGGLPIYNTTDTYGAIKGTGTRTDSNSSSIVLAIPMDGANNGTTFTDESAAIKGSGTAKTITVNGNTRTSTSQSVFYGSSAEFDGSNDNLKLPASSDFYFGSGDFTIETWFRPNNTNRMAIYHGSSGVDWSVGIDYSYITQTIGIWASSNGTQWDLADGDSSGTRGSIVVPAGGWTHIAFVRNGSSLQLYVNGVLDKQFSTTSSIADRSSYQPVIGEWWNGVYDLNGYLQDFRIYKGVAKYTSNFNPPRSPQNDMIAAGNDSLIDTPTNYDDGTNVGGNYATFSPIDSHSSNTFANGNLEATNAGVAVFANLTMGFTSGKWYCEIEANGGGNGSCMVGICDLNKPHANRKYGQTGGLYMYQSTGGLYSGGLGGSFSNTSYGSAYSDGDIIGIGLDMDNGNVRFYINGSDQGQANTTSLIGARVSPAVNNDTNSASFKLNAGQRPFTYTPPTDHLPLVTTSFDDPTIADGSTAMDAVVYSSTGGPQTISGLKISPDLVWIKNRSAAVSHRLYDIIRGVNKPLTPNDTSGEANETGLSAFNSDGFSISGSRQEVVGNSGDSLVAWTWNAGDTTVTNTDGSLTSQVRANPTAGFSIVNWTRSGGSNTATIGHGLNAAPQLIILKDRDSVSDWYVGSPFVDTSRGDFAAYLSLNRTDGFYNNSDVFTQGGPATNSTFGVGAVGNPNGNNLAYCFTPVESYSAIGSYTGNGSADGPFIYTGMRPKWIMVKRTNGLGPWLIVDTERNTYNVMDNHLLANDSAAENGSTIGNICDSLSNGFKIRGSDGWFNNSGGNYIYATFSEHPFKTARAR